MWHPDEGTIHAWIEEQLSSDEARRVSQHVESCAECRAAVAGARGSIAGASRVVGFLDQGVGVGSISSVEGRLGKATRNLDTEQRRGTATRRGDSSVSGERGWRWRRRLSLV